MKRILSGVVKKYTEAISIQIHNSNETLLKWCCELDNIVTRLTRNLKMTKIAIVTHMVLMRAHPELATLH